VRHRDAGAASIWWSSGIQAPAAPTIPSTRATCGSWSGELEAGGLNFGYANAAQILQSGSTPRHHGTPMLHVQVRVHDRSSHLKLETAYPFALREPHLEHSTRTLSNRESGRIEGHRNGSRMWLRIPLLRRPSLKVCPGRGSTIPRSRDWRGHAPLPCVEAEPGLLAVLLQVVIAPSRPEADDALP
jgi:hypothetical protein